MLFSNKDWPAAHRVSALVCWRSTSITNSILAERELGFDPRERFPDGSKLPGARFADFCRRQDILQRNRL